MKPATWLRVREVFEGALELPAAERMRFLDTSCAGDAEVRREVEELLGSDAAAPDFLELAVPAPFEPAPGTRIGPYELVRPLAAGGMGTVYEAIQDRPRRRVALKTMRSGLRSPGAVRRFRFEAEVLGRLRHPDIARVFESGVHRAGEAEHPWFAMELVEGARDLVGHAREHGLTRERRIELFLRVCEAVHHGHQRGVVHRDLKPGNVLIDAEGNPKVIDFGVARLVGAEDGAATAATLPGQLVGTLQYMSPEQVRGGSAEIDTRSDVYALGCLLHVLLTERPPYDVGGVPLHEVARIIETEEPALAAELPTELAWIVQRCLAKEPDRRYPAASELAADLRRFLRGEPVLAGPPGAAYRLRKLLRRHRFLLAATAAVVAALAVGLLQAQREARAATAALAEARREARKADGVGGFLRGMLTSVGPLSRGKDARVLDLLDAAARSIEHELADEPEARALVRNVLGETYSQLREFRAAGRHLGAALAYVQEHLPPGDPLRLDVVTSMGQFRFMTRDDAAAEELLRAAEPQALETLGPEHRVTLRLQGVLAEVVAATGSLDEAERRFDAHVRTHERLGSEPGEFLGSLGGRASVWLRQGKPDLALAELERVVELSLQASTEDSFRTWNSLHNLAIAYGELGRLAEAEAIFRDELDHVRASFDANHPFASATLISLGKCLLDQERHAEAVPIFVEALDVTRAAYGEGPLTLSIRNGLALASVGIGDTTRAAKLLREILERGRGQVPEDELRGIEERLAALRSE